MPARPYFDRLLGTVIDGQATDPARRYRPGAGLRHVGAGLPGQPAEPRCSPYADSAPSTTTCVATDELHIVRHRRPRGAGGGHRRAARPRPGRARPADTRVSAPSRPIPLDGPLAFGGWWVRIGYLELRTVAGRHGGGETRGTAPSSSRGCTRCLLSRAAASSTRSRSRSGRPASRSAPTTSWSGGSDRSPSPRRPVTDTRPDLAAVPRGRRLPRPVASRPSTPLRAPARSWSCSPTRRSTPVGSTTAGSARPWPGSTSA